MSKIDTRSRGWTVTVNNPTDDDIKNFEKIDCRYKCYEIEHEVDDGTPHIQGYLYFDNAVRFTTVKSMLSRSHLEIAKGSVLQNYDYCGKEGKIKEFGERPHSGKRNDIAVVKEMVKAGKRLREIYEVCSSYQSYRMAEIGLKLKKPKVGIRQVQVHWYHGRAGTGKTYAVYSECPDSLWISSNDLKWFDGYDGETNVLIDDLRPRDVSFNWLLRILDRYHLQVPVKGGFVDWCPTHIYITSCMSPAEFANSFNGEKSDQLLRRLSNVRNFGDKPYGSPSSPAGVGVSVLPPTPVSTPTGF